MEAPTSGQPGRKGKGGFYRINKQGEKKVQDLTDKYIAQTGLGFVDATGVVATTPVAKQRAYELGVARVAARLTAAGIPVLLVQPVPLMVVAPSNCATILVITNRCLSRTSRAAATAELSSAVAANRLVAASTANVTTVSFLDFLCGTTFCSTRSHGRENYRDAEHLSVAGALALTPDFQRLITKYAETREDEELATNRHE